ncbi:MAG: TolC family protein [Acidobacteriota bacterium]
MTDSRAGRGLRAAALAALGTFCGVHGAGAQEPPLPAAIPVLTIGEALRAALQRNPDLLNGQDALLTTRVAERGVLAGYLPQAVPFFQLDRSRDSGVRTETYGVTASEQFPFGTRLEAQASVNRNPGDFPDNPYASDYRLTLTQPLLGGADPAVTREPLRQARRSTSGQERAVEVLKRRSVIAIYSAYLGLARQEDALRFESEHVERARRLTEFSRARFSSGSLSRLDVLRAEQQEALAIVTRNDAENLVEDFRDALRRAAGLAPDLAFSIVAPSELPAAAAEIDPATAAAEIADRRPEAREARDAVVDAEFAVRIAKSVELPSLDGVLTYEGISTSATAGEALRPRNAALLFGLRSRYGLNSTLLHAQRREAEIALATRKRNYQLFVDDLVREVRRAYRRLDALRRNREIAEQNMRAAQLQVEVAQLRFEKGLSDNFNVVDAETLYNSARLYELDSRFNILLARLDCLFSAGRLDVLPFLQQP